MADENIALHECFERLKDTEQQKNALIEELLRRLDQISDDLQREKLDHARESQFNRDVQRRELQLQDELRILKANVARDPFILVLIDGDGMIFEDHLLKKGELGGKEAAASLWAAVNDYVHQMKLELSSDYKIVTRIYANLRGLGDACYRAAILENPGIIDTFARGFTGSKQLFDFVDVGLGKDRADDKISEIFKLHLNNCHCRHILFGCSHDNGYARLLEDVADTPVTDRITLLEGVPFERELNSLKSKYETKKFGGIFRTTKINAYQQQQQQQYLTFSQPTPPESHTPSAPSTSGPSINYTSQAGSSWATTAISSRACLASPPSTPQPLATASITIPRNRYGQRIDPLLKYDHNDVKRVKELHMCNVHFLRGDCPYGEECSHVHNYKPNKNELQTLKYIARLTPCRFGSECDEIKCIYGHRCPANEAGKKDCRFGINCRFDKELHGIDLHVVKTTKV